MDFNNKPKNGDWEDVRLLEDALNQGTPVPEDAPTLELLMKVAHDVGLDPGFVTKRLDNEPGRASLVVEIRRRIREGSRRLSRAIVHATKLSELGDIGGSIEVLAVVVREEPVPYYREIATFELRRIQSLGGDSQV